MNKMLSKKSLKDSLETTPHSYPVVFTEECPPFIYSLIECWIVL